MSASTLKIIACITMLIDHVGFGIICRLPSIGGSSPIYITMRLIGRMAFPIYCFLIVEGFKYTKSRLKYAIRMLLFCFISEIPFDLAFWGSPLEYEHQNVYFTLYIGLVVIWGMDLIWNRLFKRSKAAIVAVITLDLVIVFLGCFVAHFLKTDYSEAGVLTIVSVYCLRNKSKALQGGAASIVLTLLSNISEILSVFIIPLLAIYNGKRGLKLKYFFYIYYPAHLFIIYLIAVWLGVNCWIF